MESSKSLPEGYGKPWVSIYNRHVQPIMDKLHNLPLGTFVSSFWYEYNVNIENETEITIDTDNPTILDDPDLYDKATLFVQWGWILPDNKVTSSSLRKVVIREIDASFTEDGINVVFKCKDGISLLGDKPATFNKDMFKFYFNQGCNGSVVYYKNGTSSNTTTRANPTDNGNDVGGENPHFIPIGTSNDVHTQVVTPTDDNDEADKSVPKETGVVSKTTIHIGGVDKFDGSSTFSEGGSYFTHRITKDPKDTNVLYSVTGTSSNILDQVKKAIKNWKDEVKVKDNNGKIDITNYNYSAKSIYHYTYDGGHGELLEVRIRVEKSKKRINSIITHHIDPNTKVVQSTTKTVTSTDTYETNSNQPNAERGYGDNYHHIIINNNKKSQESTMRQQAENKNSSATTPIVANSVEEAANNAELTAQEEKDFENNIIESFKKLYSSHNVTGILTGASFPKFIIYRWVKKTYQDFDPAQYWKDQKHLPPVSIDNWTTYQQKGLALFQNQSGIRRVISMTPNGDGDTNVTQNHGQINATYKVTCEEYMPIELDAAKVINMAGPHLFAKQQADNGLKKALREQTVATVKVVGRPHLKANYSIDLYNISNNYSGKWFIKSAKHILTQTGYLTIMECVRKPVVVKIQTIDRNVSLNEFYTYLNKIAKERLKLNKNSNTETNIKIIKNVLREQTSKGNGDIGVVTNGNKATAYHMIDPKTQKPYSYDIFKIHQKNMNKINKKH